MYLDEEELFGAIEGGLDLSAGYHAKQLAVSRDYSNLRVVIGGRRSGKTTFFSCDSLELADQFPGLTVPYIGPTVGRARDVMLPQMRKVERDYGITLDYNLSEHKIYTPSGGCVQLFGLATMAEVEKGRGGSYPGVYIDEAGAIVNQDLLKRAVRETFGPATKDFFGIGGRGIVIGGTPTYVPGTYWEQLCGGNEHKSKFGASVHHMTIYDNPFFAGREELIIAAFLEENSLTRDSSVVRREWDGLFCIDTDGLAYPSWRDIILPMHLVPLGGFTVLGVDFGSNHPCAWVVVRFILAEQVIDGKVFYTHHAHVIESYEESGLSVHDVRDITRVFQETYGVSATYGDPGGGGAMTIDTINDVMGVQIEAVTKAGHKEDRIWMTDSMIRAGTMHVHEKAQTLREQLNSVPIETKSNGLRDHMTGYHDHSLDALHYALLGAKQHQITLPLPPRPGTLEFQLHHEAREAAVLLPGRVQTRHASLAARVQRSRRRRG